MPSEREIEAAAQAIRSFVAEIEVASDGKKDVDPMISSHELARAALEAAERVRAEEWAPLPIVPTIS